MLVPAEEELPDGRKRHKLSFPAKPGPTSLDQLTQADVDVLRHFAKGARLIIDVGTFLGASAEAMAGAMPEDGRLITIDTFRGTTGTNTGGLKDGAMLMYATQRLSVFGTRVNIIVGDSADIAKTIKPGIADLVFIDAAHDYENVKADIEAWLPAVKPDGLLLGHDFDRHSAIPMKMEEMRQRAHLEYDEETGVHVGVIVAVADSFNHIILPDVEGTSVWAAKPSEKVTNSRRM